LSYFDFVAVAHAADGVFVLEFVNIGAGDRGGRNRRACRRFPRSTLAAKHARHGIDTVPLRSHSEV
jgi:hypothetical protein